MELEPNQHSENSGRPTARRRPSKHDVSNVGSLAAIQVFNAFTPLIAYPFILAQIGQEGFAQIVVAEAIALFLLSFVLYSFEVDGVATVVGLEPRKDNAAISAIFVQIILLRLCLYCLGLLVLQLILTLFSPDLRMLVLGWSLVALSYAIQPNWLFQGLERNFPLAVCVVVSRACALGSILVFVRNEADADYVPFIIGGWYVVGAFAALTYATVHFGLRLQKVGFTTLVGMMWHGKEVYLNSVATGLYRDSNVLLLSLLGVPAAGIASYSLAEKLTKALQAAMRPLNQFFFPRAIAIAKEEGSPSPAALKRILAITLPQMGVALVLILLGVIAYSIGVRVVDVRHRVDDITLVFELTLIMAVSVLPGVGVFMLGIAGLNALGARGYLLIALFFAAGVSIIANVLLIPYLGAFASAISFVLTESILFGLIVRRFLRQG